MVDLDVLEEEGGGAAFIRFAGSGAVLPRAEQEEEGDDAEVDGMAVDRARGWVPEVEALEHGFKVADVGGVDALGRVVFIAEGLEESSEYGIDGAREGDPSRIRFTQVGDPLCHVSQCLANGISPYTSTFASSQAIPEAEDEEDAEPGLPRVAVQGASEVLARISDITEGWGEAVLVAELGPETEEGGLGALGLRGGIVGGGLQSSAEVSCETHSLGSRRNRQGRGCG